MRKKKSLSIIFIGIVSLLINVSSTVVYTITPLYLSTVLNVSNFNLGIYEGIAETIAWSSRIFSGMLSDYLLKRKPLLIVAYLISISSRFIFSGAITIKIFFMARFFDRLGNGIQASARDALIGDLADIDNKGTAYGLRQSLSVLGSLIGGGIAFFVLRYYTNFSSVFLFSIVPIIISIAILFFLVSDAEPEVNSQPHKAHKLHLAELFDSNEFWQILFLSCIFMASNYSGFFTILYSTKIVNNSTIAAIVMISQNLGGTLAAYPIGYLADRYNQNIILSFGISLVIISNIIYSLATNYIIIILASFIWGIQLNVNQSLFATKIANATTKITRGTAFGIYYVTSGLMIFVGNLIMGWSFDKVSPSLALQTSSIFALCALILLIIQHNLKKI